MKKFLFSTPEGWQALTADDGYATYGRKGYHNLPLFKTEGKNIFELRGSEYKLLRECGSEVEAQKTLAHWTADDDDNVSVYETLADAEKSVRDAYEGEPEFEAQMTDLCRAATLGRLA